jgi:ParB family chromosome partitioning protein
VIGIPLSEIDGFINHTFKVTDDEAMQNLAESIKTYGVQTPATVRAKPDGRYELISGHRRKRACEIAEVDTIPAIIKEMTDDDAIIFMIDSNLQREKILLSEKAFSYKMKLEVLKRQGKRTDLTSAPLVQKSGAATSRSQIAKEAGESHEQIRRYIRLTELIPGILQLVDDEKIAFRPAVELSYLSKDNQAILLSLMQTDECTPSLSQAIKMKQFEQDGKLSDNVILSILSEEKGNQAEMFKMPKKSIEKFFPSGTKKKDAEAIIIKALELYFHRNRDINRDRERKPDR